MSPGEEQPPRASMEQQPHLPKKAIKKKPQTTKPLFPDTCGEAHRERVNLLMAKLTLSHKETFPGLCREAALPTHPALAWEGAQIRLFFLYFLYLFNKEMHSERELFCEQATCNINCFASIEELVNCIFSHCFPLLQKAS